MKKTIEKDDRLTKTVFSKSDNLYPEYSKYPLGEDFYSIQTENPNLEYQNTFLKSDLKI